jgi:hypothetical protein
LDLSLDIARSTLAVRRALCSRSIVLLAEVLRNHRKSLFRGAFKSMRLCRASSAAAAAG